MRRRTTNQQSISAALRSISALTVCPYVLQIGKVRKSWADLSDCTALPKSLSKSSCSLDLPRPDRQVAVVPHEVDDPEHKAETASSRWPRLKTVEIWQDKTARDPGCYHQTDNFFEQHGDFIESSQWRKDFVKHLTVMVAMLMFAARGLSRSRWCETRRISWCSR